jgi:hypothetical protein
MKFFSAFFKRIQPSDDFCWIIIFFSKIDANGSHCFVHFLYNSGERHRLLRDPLILNVISLVSLTQLKATTIPLEYYIQEFFTGCNGRKGIYIFWTLVLLGSL